MSLGASAILNLLVLPMAGLFVLNIWIVWLLVNKIFPIPETAPWGKCVLCSALMAVISVLAVIVGYIVPFPGVGVLVWVVSYRFLLEVLFDLSKVTARSVVIICAILNVGGLFGALYLGGTGLARGYEDYGRKIEAELQRTAPFELEIELDEDIIMVSDPATGNGFSGSVLGAWSEGTAPEQYAAELISKVELANEIAVSREQGTSPGSSPPRTKSSPPRTTASGGGSTTSASPPATTASETTKAEESDDPWGSSSPAASDAAAGSAKPADSAAPNRDLELAQANVFVKSAGDKWAKGDYEGALQLADKAYQFRLIHLGAEHVDTLAVLEMIKAARAQLD